MAKKTQFQVHPPTLTGLAGTFESEGQGLVTETAAFHTGASDVAKAFGVLGACDGASAKYAKLLGSTVTALGQLSQVLDSDGARLRANAAQYTATEVSVSQTMKSVPVGGGQAGA